MLRVASFSLFLAVGIQAQGQIPGTTIQSTGTPASVISPTADGRQRGTQASVVSPITFRSYPSSTPISSVGSGST